MNRVFSHLISFSLGITTAIVLVLIVKAFHFLFFGFEIQGRASFPRRHMARLYTRTGFGDQNLRLVVDGSTVYVSPDFQPGELNEEILWDKTGRVVTVLADCEKVFSFDAESWIEIKE